MLVHHFNNTLREKRSSSIGMEPKSMAGKGLVGLRMLFFKNPMASIVALGLK